MVIFKKKLDELKLLTDDVDTTPVNDFIPLAETLSAGIKQSDPHFTIGIYGGWGTGKTTLMKLIEKNLTDNSIPKNKTKILPIWFNAWRYEREEQLATVALMKIIAFAMADHEKFDSVASLIKKSLRIVGKDVGRQLLSLLIEEKGIKEFDEQLSAKMEFLNTVEKETIYYDGLEAISKQIQKIRRGKGKDYRIVVFIDDLDGCSPPKVLEVLESIKVFLDMPGFVYVIGLSDITIHKLISHAYENMGVQGSDYIQKIIQIPIRLPSWNPDNLKYLISSKIVKSLPKNFSKIILNNSGYLVQAVNNNPRQLKRFINNLILGFYTFSNSKKESISLQKLFAVQILKTSKPMIIKRIQTDHNFRTQFEKIMSILDSNLILVSTLNQEKRWIVHGSMSRKKLPAGIRSLQNFLNFLKETQENTANPVDQSSSDFRKEKRNQLVVFLNETFPRGLTGSTSVLLSTLDYDDWQILKKFGNSIVDLDDWSVYDRASEISDNLPVEKFLDKK